MFDPARQIEECFAVLGDSPRIMDEGEIEVDSIRAISLAEITPELARRSGFEDVAELLKIAKHGSGENIYLIRFHYSPSFLPRVLNRPARRRAAQRGAAGRDPGE